MRLADRTDIAKTCSQLASNGNWERAFVVDAARPNDLSRWLDAAGADVAVEAVYADAYGQLAGFVGFRSRIADPKTRRAFWSDVLAIDAGSAAHQIAAWLTFLGAPDLLASPAAHCELGVFNLWKSAGPLVLPSCHLTAELSANGPEWIRAGAPAPICLERAWTTPVEFWLADVVSRADGERHVVAAEFLSDGRQARA